MGVHHGGLHHFAFLLISHDLSMVRFISDRTGVMLQGRLAEVAPTEELFSHPLHSYTRSLLSAVRGLRAELIGGFRPGRNRLAG